MLERENLEDFEKTIDGEHYYVCAEANKVMNAMEVRIKELEQELEQANRLIAVLEASKPKWISVEERLPNKKDFDEDLQDAYGVDLWITDGLTTYFGSYIFENKTFYKDRDLKEPIKTTHWMYGKNWIPKPPTTEKSTEDIKENLITEQTNDKGINNG